MKKWYEEYFENFAESYDREEYTKGTIGEVDFIEKETGFDKTVEILDIGCGTGRHAIELAKRGYRVTGIDLSESQLAKAREKALKQNVAIDFHRADARHLDFRNRFGMAILICEGAFPLMETDEMNFAILENARNALEPGGKLILTTFNGLFPFYHSTEKFLNEGGLKTWDHHWDPLTLRDSYSFESVDDSGNKKTLRGSDRYYMPSEIAWYLKTLSFTDIGIYGCKINAFSRDDKLTPDDYEMLVVAKLP